MSSCTSPPRQAPFLPVSGRCPLARRFPLRHSPHDDRQGHDGEAHAGQQPQPQAADERLRAGGFSAEGRRHDRDHRGDHGEPEALPRCMEVFRRPAASPRRSSPAPPGRDLQGDDGECEPDLPDDHAGDHEGEGSSFGHPRHK
jgi:hypothetical protein